jgi:hypothetical protein
MRPSSGRTGLLAHLASAAASALLVALASPPAAAIDGGSRAQGASSARPPTGLPPGHPVVDSPPSGAGTDEQLPPGHPPTRSSTQGGSMLEQPPEDTSVVDDRLSRGSLVVEVRDQSERPVPNTDVTLGILQQSVAKGESRRRTTQKTDDAGTARFEGLETGTGVAYRISVPWASSTGSESATYAAPPFQLDLHHGQRVRVHVYPVTHRLEDTLLGMQAIAYVELRDDVLQIDQLFQVYNMGSVTWVPSDVVVALPRGFKAWSAQRDMSDTGFDQVPDRGAKMRGTFAPGQHQVQFRYQIPYEGGESVQITLALPPRVIRTRVIAEASKSMTLRVADFPSAVSDRNQKGQRVLLTERQLRAGEQPLSQVRIFLDNIPTEGSAKWITVGIATATIAFGLYLAFEQEKEKGKSKSKTHLPEQDSERARARLVAEIAALDRASKAGEVGPKAYTRIRAALVDSLARLMGMSDAREPT